MEPKIFNVLFLCSGNSARSIMAEKLMEHWGKGRFKAYSAGSFPKSQVNPLTIKTLESHGLNSDGLRCKSWGEFSGFGAPHMDFVFTVCDDTAGEVCPIWPGQPMTAHWGIEDPEAVEGTDSEKLKAFQRSCRYLENRIKLFIALPIDTLNKLKIKDEIDAIGAIKEDYQKLNSNLELKKN
ncbi:arsenate reductase ArsC [Methylotenera sp.]|uniref:arsenate reductase ArsC n=1 Tax=Methylotenera sp. TaxID=2051956 RepID=UPI00272F556A|nr:arsenate reductase ArsC [Methylotenera sp.]MDP2071701.1 arsenate reductase ArsC [Methylotenera sp.]MDP2229369.1 arsenate reductase ArsC [Methylotenera sp.]MDP3007435.1 arsenate reductase ArsC [Methylotenera sp.]MDP3140527.1 arsenate reductase ArsC [Methylotenera sp.]